MPPLLPSLVTGLALLLYAVLGINVSLARGRYKIEAPATTGDPAFERVCRVHQNTLEQLVLFLPALWLFTHFVSPFWGGVIGFVWILGRIAFAWGYYRDAKQRAAGYVIGTACSLILLLGGLIGVVRLYV